jgi:hypothetical protein
MEYLMLHVLPPLLRLCGVLRLRLCRVLRLRLRLL